jgi:hypothetical protein
MALTAFQLDLCRLIARQRVESGESYVAGGTALNSVLGASRVSRDVDLFHDTLEAVAESFAADRKLLTAGGYDLRIQRERAGFVEAVAARGGDSVVLQWAADSAFRFFPLVEHPDFGLMLHPFDLATNKVLALVGRVEVRDWVDVMGCHERIQRLGYLAWAACGKDPGFSPAGILEQAGRSSRYSAAEIASLNFSGPPPVPGKLSQAWHAMLDEAREIVALLPFAEVGKCVIDEQGKLFSGDPPTLRHAAASGSLRFHEGRIRGALPEMRGGG